MSESQAHALRGLHDLRDSLERDVRLASTRDQHIRASSRVLALESAISLLEAGESRDGGPLPLPGEGFGSSDRP